MSTNLKKQIGSNIRTERLSRGISMEELAEMLEISPAFVGLIERGQRGASVKNLIKISKIFSISIDSLISEEDTSSISSKVGESKKDDSVSMKRETVKSLLYDLNEAELEFIISTVRNLRKLRCSSVELGEVELEDYLEEIEVKY